MCSFRKGVRTHSALHVCVRASLQSVGSPRSTSGNSFRSVFRRNGKRTRERVCVSVLRSDVRLKEWVKPLAENALQAALFQSTKQGPALIGTLDVRGSSPATLRYELFGDRSRNLTSADGSADSTSRCPFETGYRAKKNNKTKLNAAAHALLQDYKEDTNLTEFTVLDADDFHATR